MKTSAERLFAALEKEKERWTQTILGAREMVLGNLSMISQTPALTFRESERSELIVNRFTESGVIDPSTDLLQNAFGYYRQESPLRKILIFTHMDNRFEYPIDQSITIMENKVYGAGVAVDNIAIAVLLTLPDILNRLNLSLNSDLIFLATTRSHGRGDFGGIRYFIEKHGGDIDAVVYLMNGTTLGMIDYFTLSRVRCDIMCELSQAQEKAWTRSMSDSAIMVLNEIVSGLFSIPLPRKPKTILNVGSISGGEGYNTISREAIAKLEALSEDDRVMDKLIDEIGVQCTDIGAKHGVLVNPSFFGRHHAAGLTSAHPLVKTAMNIIKGIGFQPAIEYSNTEITVPLARGIPSVGLGITTGVSGVSAKCFVDIEPISLGILQVLQLLYAIDKDYGKNE